MGEGARTITPLAFPATLLSIFEYGQCVPVSAAIFSSVVWLLSVLFFPPSFFNKVEGAESLPSFFVAGGVVPPTQSAFWLALVVF